MGKDLSATVSIKFTNLLVVGNSCSDDCVASFLFSKLISFIESWSLKIAEGRVEVIAEILVVVVEGVVNVAEVVKFSLFLWSYQWQSDG